MIQPQELRIGNYVTINNPNSWIELLNIPIIVTGIDFSMTKKEKEIWAHSNGKIRVENEYNNYNQFSQFIDPIPLTEEILLKFGFEKIKSDEYPHKYIINKYMSDEVEIENLNSQNCFIFSHGKKFSSIKIEYVHQLQNLYFSLTGKELAF